MEDRYKDNLENFREDLKRDKETEADEKFLKCMLRHGVTPDDLFFVLSSKKTNKESATSILNLGFFDDRAKEIDEAYDVPKGTTFRHAMKYVKNRKE